MPDMLSKDDFQTLNGQNQLPEYVIPIYGTQSAEQRPSTTKLAYDITALLLLVLDLCLLLIDSILMSDFMTQLVSWFGVLPSLENYQQQHHPIIKTIGGFFTLFWVVDLLVRWMIAIYKKTYYRWFFFPFTHWYEVLGCFPALRALRLLRAIVIIKRLHKLNIKIIPERWLRSARFYYHVILEEMSDRVILTAIDNFRTQLNQYKNQQNYQPVIQNRHLVETLIFNLLKSELTPRLQAALLAEQGQKLSDDIGIAVEEAIKQTPEMRRYLKLIPIAGVMIESQITNLARNIAENITTSINQHLFDDTTLDGLMKSIAHGIAHLDTSNPELQSLITTIIEDALVAFEQQVKMQQWKHSQQLP